MTTSGEMLRRSMDILRKRRTIMDLKPVIIGAPFGNYLQFPGCSPTLGTYTLHRRRGRWRRILRTVRYYPRPHAWVNQIGLRNPGIQHLEYKFHHKGYKLSDKILSIHGFDTEEWEILLRCSLIMAPMALELNISCPNVSCHEPISYGDLFRKAVSTKYAAAVPTNIIVKLPPKGYKPIVHEALEAGIDMFHCFNTLPTPGGGLSGKPLLNLYPEMIQELKKENTAYPQMKIIGGGGISTKEDMERYLYHGADYVSVASALFFPWKWRKIREASEQLALWGGLPK